MTEYLILVDENDHPIGTEEKIKAHKNASLHRAFSVFILRRKNKTLEILLQQRNPKKYHCGNLWTNTCCGHPRPNENTQQAAERRLFEEMGIKTSLTALGKFHYQAKFDNGLTEHEIDHVFFAYHDDSEFIINPDEIADIQWISLEALKEKLENEPDRFTPWLKPALKCLTKNLVSSRA